MAVCLFVSLFVCLFEQQVESMNQISIIHRPLFIVGNLDENKPVLHKDCVILLHLSSYLVHLNFGH